MAHHCITEFDSSGKDAPRNVSLMRAGRGGGLWWPAGLLLYHVIIFTNIFFIEVNSLTR